MRQQEVKIENMTQIQAVEIADTWKYEGIYKFYDMTEDPEDYAEITDSVLRGDRYWSVLDGEKLIGFFCLEPDDETVELGLGLKPEYTGKGFGKEFVDLIVDFIRKNYHFKEIMLSVVSFNNRAIRCYEKCGFRKTCVIPQKANGSLYEFVIMQLEI